LEMSPGHDFCGDIPPKEISDHCGWSFEPIAWLWYCGRFLGLLSSHRHHHHHIFV